jgi:hypothetical protein
MGEEKRKFFAELCGKYGVVFRGEYSGIELPKDEYVGLFDYI